MDHGPVVLGRSVSVVPKPNNIHFFTSLRDLVSEKPNGLRWITTAEGASAMVDSVCEVLYKTHRHASRPYTPNYPPVQQSNAEAKGSFVSPLSARGGGVMELVQESEENEQTSIPLSFPKR